MPWKPSEPGEVPTLGWQVIDWIHENLAHPANGGEWQLYREVEDFILRFYELDPFAPNPVYRHQLGRRKIQRALLGRPRGFSKSPVLGAIMLCEGLGPVVPEGWDSDGQPVGVPWSEHISFLGQVTAVNEDQTKNTWRAMQVMCEGPVVDNYPGLEPMDTMMNIPGGVIEQRTSSGRGIKGSPSQFVVLDQTEEWVKGNGGPDFADAIWDNVAKVGGSSIESPNAYIPGEDSVAESSAKYASDVREGRAIANDLLWDHREAPPETDLYERESLTMGLRVAYGDASGHPDGCVIHDPPCPPGHADLESRISRIWQSGYDPQKARSNFLNQITFASNSWMDQPTWAARRAQDQQPPPPGLADGQIIALGFDGSRGKANTSGKTKRKPDATALIGCRVNDGHLFELGVWEPPEDPKTWATWSPPIVEIEALLESVFKKYRIGAFYCDPAKDWRSHVNAWEAKYSGKLVRALDGKTVTVTRDHPFEWWMSSGRSGLVQRAIEQLEGAIRLGDMTHDNGAGLTRHVINARRKMVSGKLRLVKENDYSPKKIDAAVAATLAWQARLDCIAAGIGQQPASQFVAPERFR